MGGSGSDSERAWHWLHVGASRAVHHPLQRNQARHPGAKLPHTVHLQHWMLRGACYPWEE
jgi:hypothetical protein